MTNRHQTKILNILNDANNSGDVAKAKRQLIGYRRTLEQEAKKLDDASWATRRELLLAMEKVDNAKKIL